MRAARAEGSTSAEAGPFQRLHGIHLFPATSFPGGTFICRSPSSAALPGEQTILSLRLNSCSPLID